MNKMIWSSSLQKFVAAEKVEELFGYKGPRGNKNQQEAMDRLKGVKGRSRGRMK